MSNNSTIKNDELNDKDNKSDKKHYLKHLSKEKILAKEMYRGKDGNTHCLVTNGLGEIISDELVCYDKERWDKFYKSDSKNKETDTLEELDEK